MTIKTITAIPGVCAWPNLQQLTDGTLVATIFNQPCHGQWEGDLDCWASEDGGETWRYRSTPAKHEPGTNRMNCAVGFAANGDLLVLCSGWDSRLPVGKGSSTAGAKCLTPWICRSKDGARTWAVEKGFPNQPGGTPYIPFGDIIRGNDNHLRAFVYGKTEGDPALGKDQEAFVLTSKDDGTTWDNPVLLNECGNETMGIHLGVGKWLAASREVLAGDTHLFVSQDDARTWQRKYPLSLPQQHNGHLLMLKDGRLVLTLGNRCKNNCGIDVRISEDRGESWGAPNRIADTEIWDCGYPSTIERSDGMCVTAWYTQLPGKFPYEMRVTIWDDQF